MAEMKKKQNDQNLSIKKFCDFFEELAILHEDQQVIAKAQHVILSSMLN